MFGFLTQQSTGSPRSVADGEDRVGVASPVAVARRHRAAAARDARVRRHAPVAARARLESRGRRRVPRLRARRRPAPAHQAVRRERRYLRTPCRTSLAGAPGDVPGLHLRLPDGARAGARADRQSALEARHSAPVLASHPLLRHRRQAARVPLRAVDPGQVDGAAPALHARGRARGRARAGVALRSAARIRRSGRSSRNTCSCC